MSGHSKWAKTHRQKAVTDAKRGAIFTKLGNLIVIAAKEGGGDTESNFKLRLAIEKAKSSNMPKDNIDRAIKKGAGIGDGKNIIEEAVYEIFGPASSTFILETVTDNKNRTLSDVKMALNKNGGQMGATGSVAWMYKHKGIITINPTTTTDHDQLELDIIDAGAQDIIKNDDAWEIYTLPDELQATEKKLKSKNLQIIESNLGYIAKDELNITDSETQDKIDRLFTTLDELDDASNVYTNANW